MKAQPGQVYWGAEYAQVLSISTSSGHDPGFGLASAEVSTAYVGGLEIPPAVDIFNAIWESNLDALERILYSGSPLEIFDAQDNTPLIAAVHISNKSIVDYLLRYGADVDRGVFQMFQRIRHYTKQLPWRHGHLSDF